MPKSRATYLLLTLFLCLFSSVLQANEIVSLKNGVQVRPLFPAGNFYTEGMATPLVLELTNQTSKPQSVQLQWNGNEKKVPTAPIEITAGSTKRLSMYLTNSEVQSLHQLKANNQRISLHYSHRVYTQWSLGVLSSEEDKFSYVRAYPLQHSEFYNSATQKNEAKAIPLSDVFELQSETFPEHWAALRALNVIVCHNLTELRLNQRQYRALVNWVRHGGHLVLSSNGLSNEYRNTPLKELIPLTDQTVDSSGSHLRIQGELSERAKITFGSMERPILISRTELLGAVHLATISLIDPKTLGEEENKKLWLSLAALITSPSQNWAHGGHATGMASYYGAVPAQMPSPQNFATHQQNDLPELPRVRGSWLALFVLLYGILVGPVNLTILRKKDKMLWSFVTIPAIALLFAAGAYFLSAVFRPGKPVLRELGYLNIKAGERTGILRSDLLFFTPSKSTQHLVGEQAGFHFGPGYYYSQNDRLIISELAPEGGFHYQMKMNSWDVQRLESIAIREFATPLSVQFDSVNKILSVESPIASEAKTAILFRPGFGSSEPFVLKKGAQTYPIVFPQTATGSLIIDDKEKNKDREQLQNIVESQITSKKYNQDSEEMYLIFWSQDLAHSLEADKQTARPKAHLVNVSFQS